MNKVMILVGMLGAVSAQADGFVCESVSRDLTVKVFNHTDSQIGTRAPAVMIVSDPRLSEGRKTIATFSDAQGLLTKSSSTYAANVDLRYASSNRAGILIGGTKLGELDEIQLAVDFSYREPLAFGETTKGVITLVKRNGREILFDAECARYLKK